MADRLMDGQLADRLAELHSEGRSADEVSRILYAEAGIEVTAVTVRAWWARLFETTQVEAANPASKAAS